MIPIILLLISSLLQASPIQQADLQPVALRYKFSKGTVLHYQVDLKVDVRIIQAGSPDKILNNKRSKVLYLAIDGVTAGGLAKIRCQRWNPEAFGEHRAEEFPNQIVHLLLSPGGELVGPVSSAGVYRTAVDLNCLATNLFMSLSLRPVKPGDAWRGVYASLTDNTYYTQKRQSVEADIRFVAFDGNGSDNAILKSSYTIPVDIAIGKPKPRLIVIWPGDTYDIGGGNISVKEETVLSVKTGQVVSRMLTATGSIETASKDLDSRGKDGEYEKPIGGLHYTSTMTIRLKKYAPGDPMPPSLEQEMGGAKKKKPARKN